MSKLASVYRCINIDWLEVYCLEPSTTDPHNAEYFRRAGYFVTEREYGTPVYHEMFTLYGTDGLPLIEVRRNPKSAAGRQINGVLAPESTHIRLCNRTCYMDDAANIMETFIQRHNYILMRISRIDICLDFEKFDFGDDPNKFLQRYVQGKYSKINQSQIALHGLDCWDGRHWNSAKWGNPKSMVTTKLYNKTMELQQKSDKPYIRQAWFNSKLIDDWHTCEKYDKNEKPYKPSIWRLEFSIKSSTKNWFVVENPYNTKPKLRSIRHTLEQYKTKQQLLDVFFSLCNHYFHFKKVEYIDGAERGADRRLQRKDRCSDKQLFDTSNISTFYKVANVATSEHVNSEQERLLRYLYRFHETTIDKQQRSAAAKIIEYLEQITHRNDFSSSLDEQTITLLRLLVSKRIQNAGLTVNEDMQAIKTMLAKYSDLFN